MRRATTFRSGPGRYRLNVTGIDVALEPESGAQISAGDIAKGVVTTTLNGANGSEWDESPHLSLFVNSHQVDAELDEYHSLSRWR